MNTPNHAYPSFVGYVSADGSALELNDSMAIPLTEVSTWKTGVSNWVSSTRTAYRAEVAGHVYSGQGYGRGMWLKLRRGRRF